MDKKKFDEMAETIIEEYCLEWGDRPDIEAFVAYARKDFEVQHGEYVPDVDGERYRAIRDKGIAFSAWQDENGVQWAVNGRVGKDLDALVDEELLKRGISPETTK